MPPLSAQIFQGLQIYFCTAKYRPAPSGGLAWEGEFLFSWKPQKIAGVDPSASIEVNIGNRHHKHLKCSTQPQPAPLSSLGKGGGGNSGKDRAGKGWRG